MTATAKTGSCICKLDDVNMPIQNRLSAAICIFHRECTPSGCPSLRDNQTHCANTVIQRRAFPETEVYQTPHCGNGLRLLENVTPGTAIVEYTGQVISDDECTARRNKLKNNEDFYFASLCAGYVLDAKPMGSRARFANHSCQPNCEMQKWVVGGEPRLVLVSLAAIEAGSDVTYNYHCHDDGLEVKIKRQKCLCGAKCCAGTIGGRVTKTEFDKWSQRAQSLLRSDKWIHIDAYRRHIEAASDVSSILYKDLKGVVDLVDDWVRDTYSPVFAFLRCGFSGQFELRSSEYIENVLSTFPVKNVRCDEYQHVNQIYKTAGKVGKRVEQYICDFNAPVEAAVGDLGMTEAPQQMEVEEVNMRYSDTVDWTCLMSLFKDIAAVLPMRCVQRALIDRALDLYEGTSRWARSLYARTASPTPVSEWTTSKASAWSAIARISNFYGREMSPYSFMLEKTLDRNLSLYIRRAQLLLDLASCQSSGQTAISEGYTHRAVLSTTSFHDIHLGVDPEFLIAEEREEGEPEEGHDEHTPHCLCRLPETEGESATLVQCENCDSWLHPQCINRRGLEGGAIRAKRAVFVCPLCLHVDNAVSSLADVVSQEWFDRHLFKKPKNAFSLFSNYNQLLPEGIEALCPYQFGTTSNDNGGIQNLFLDTLSDVFSVFTTGSKVTLTASLNDSASKCKVKVRANVTPKTADSRRSGPWSEVELAAFLKAAEMLPLKRVSVCAIILIRCTRRSVTYRTFAAVSKCAVTAVGIFIR